MSVRRMKKEAGRRLYLRVLIFFHAIDFVKEAVRRLLHLWDLLPQLRFKFLSPPPHSG